MNVSNALSLFLASTLFSSAALAQATGSDRISNNLLANADFDSNLSGWTEEQHSNYTSNWDTRDYQGSGTSGSLRAESKESGAPYVGDIAWQCFDVVPGDVYAFGAWARLHPDTDEHASDTGYILVAATASDTCPSSVTYGIDNATFGDGQKKEISPSGASWISEASAYAIPQDVNRIRLSLAVNSAAAGGTGHPWDRPNVLAFDHAWFGREKPSLQAALSASNVNPFQGIPFDVTLTLDNAGRNSARDPIAWIRHGERLRLLGESCPGTVSEVTSNNVRQLRWSGMPAIAAGGSTTCTFTAMVELGSTAPFSLQATVFSSDGNLRLDDGIDALGMQSKGVPEMDSSVELSPALPSAGGELTVRLTYRNTGTASTAADLYFEVSENWSMTRDNCPHSSQGLAFMLLEAGQTYECERRLRIPSAFSGEVTADSRVAVRTGWSNPAPEYDASNNADEDSAVVVNLRVNREADGWDRDPGDGVCEQTAGVGDCTLRGAVMEANALGGRREITVPWSASSYALDRTSCGDDEVYCGDIDIRTQMIISGEPNASGQRPIVQAAFPTASAARIFSVAPASGSSSTIIRDLVLSGQGLAIPTSDGDGHGGLVHHGARPLLLRDVVLRNGRAANLRRGGALYSNAGGVFADDALTLVRVEAHDNAANAGGAIAVAPTELALVSIQDSAIHDNEAEVTAGIGGFGGGVFVHTADAIVGVVASTLSGNHARDGGGLALYASPNVILRNATVSGNTASARGGGIRLTDSDLSIDSSTIVYNEAAPGDSSAGEGGGIWHDGASTPTLRNSILAYNSAKVGSPVAWPISGNCHPSLTSTGYNSFSSGSLDSGCTIITVVGSQGDTPNGAPSLTPLQDNGGPTPTHGLASAGDELDLGDCGSGLGALTVDQRGAARPADGDGNGSLLCDKGAYELSDSARVSVVKSGTGTGLVFSTPSGILCGDACEALFGLGAEITLTANTPADNVFTGWGGACAAFGTAPCVLEAGGNLEVEAQFESTASTHTLTVSLGEDGNGTVSSDPSGIDCPTGCSNSFDAGTAVTLTATAAADSVFLGFFGAGCDGSTDPCTVSMDADRSVSAVFDHDYVDLEVTIAGSGVGRVVSSPIGVDCPGDCADKYPITSSVTLDAQPAVGSVFTGWSGACSGTGACALDMDLGPHAATATFDLQPDRLFGDGFE